MFKVGDEVFFTSFEGSGNGRAVIVGLERDISEFLRERHPNYEIKTNILVSDDEDINNVIGGKHAYYWYFPRSLLTPVELQYDPNQQGDTEDDI